MDFDARTTALSIARGRVVIGLVMVAVPGVVARVMFGRTSGEARTLLRMLGARDVVLGVGAITSVKEGTHDAEWVSMGAAADGVDTVALLLAPGNPARRVGNAITAATAAAMGMLCARQIADSRPAPA
jgi:hypothetical protein